MAHSIQEINGRVIILNDFDVTALIRLIFHSPFSHALSNRAKKIVEEWNESLELSGPGAIDLCLEIHLGDETDHLAILEILNFAKAAVKAFDKNIPLNIVGGGFDKKPPPTGYPTNHIRDVITKIDHFIASSRA